MKRKSALFFSIYQSTVYRIATPLSRLVLQNYLQGWSSTHYLSRYKFLYICSVCSMACDYSSPLKIGIYLAAQIESWIHHILCAVRNSLSQPLQRWTLRMAMWESEDLVDYSGSLHPEFLGIYPFKETQGFSNGKVAFDLLLKKKYTSSVHFFLNNFRYT